MLLKMGCDSAHRAPQPIFIHVTVVVLDADGFDYTMLKARIVGE